MKQETMFEFQSHSKPSKSGLAAGESKSPSIQQYGSLYSGGTSGKNQKNSTLTRLKDEWLTNKEIVSDISDLQSPESTMNNKIKLYKMATAQELRFPRYRGHGRDDPAMQEGGQREPEHAAQAQVDSDEVDSIIDLRQEATNLQHNGFAAVGPMTGHRSGRASGSESLPYSAQGNRVHQQSRSSQQKQSTSQQYHQQEANRPTPELGQSPSFADRRRSSQMSPAWVQAPRDNTSGSRTSQRSTSPRRQKLTQSNSTFLARQAHYQLSKRQTKSMWLQFEQRIRGSMFGTLTQEQQIKHKEDILNSSPNLSPDERSYLRRSIERDRQSMEREKRTSTALGCRPLRDWSSKRRKNGQYQAQGENQNLNIAFSERDQLMEQCKESIRLSLDRAQNYQSIASSKQLISPSTAPYIQTELNNNQYQSNSNIKMNIQENESVHVSETPLYQAFSDRRMYQQMNAGSLNDDEDAVILFSGRNYNQKEYEVLCKQNNITNVVNQIKQRRTAGADYLLPRQMPQVIPEEMSLNSFDLNRQQQSLPQQAEPQAAFATSMAPPQVQENDWKTHLVETFREQEQNVNHENDHHPKAVLQNQQNQNVFYKDYLPHGSNKMEDVLKHYNAKEYLNRPDQESYFNSMLRSPNSGQAMSAIINASLASNLQPQTTSMKQNGRIDYNKYGNVRNLEFANQSNDSQSEMSILARKQRISEEVQTDSQKEQNKPRSLLQAAAHNVSGMQEIDQDSFFNHSHFGGLQSSLASKQAPQVISNAVPSKDFNTFVPQPHQLRLSSPERTGPIKPYQKAKHNFEPQAFETAQANHSNAQSYSNKPLQHMAHQTSSPSTFSRITPSKAQTYRHDKKHAEGSHLIPPLAPSYHQFNKPSKKVSFTDDIRPPKSVRSLSQYRHQKNLNAPQNTFNTIDIHNDQIKSSNPLLSNQLAVDSLTDSIIKAQVNECSIDQERSQDPQHRRAHSSRQLQPTGSPPYQKSVTTQNTLNTMKSLNCIKQPTSINQQLLDQFDLFRTIDQTQAATMNKENLSTNMSNGNKSRLVMSRSMKKQTNVTSLQNHRSKSHVIRERVTTIHQQIEPLVFGKHSDAKVLKDLVHKLVNCEKILNGPGSKKMDDEELEKVRLFNAYQLCLVYSKLGDTQRFIRFFEHGDAKNQNFKSLVDRLALKAKLSCKESENYILHLYQMLADTLMLEKQYKKAAAAFLTLCKIYSKWKFKFTLQDKITAQRHQFGVDDYIRTKASYAECLMHLGQYNDAIEKFESTKNQIENEIIYENPMIFVNVCNQLGNCYQIQAHSLKCQSRQQYLMKALENFESSLCLIEKMKKGEVAESLQGKICLNIALIRSELQDYNQSVIMHLKSIDHKRQQKDSRGKTVNDEIRDQYILLANSQQKAQLFTDACASLEEALLLQIQQHGELSYKSAQIMTEAGFAYLQNDQYTKCIKHLEHASMIMARLETSKGGPLRNQLEMKIQDVSKQKIGEKLDQLYLQLTDLYLTVDKLEECFSVVQILEKRQGEALVKDDYAFGILNEIANLLRKHDNLDLATQFYKKALLYIKRRYKAEYLEQFCTSQILVNIATVQRLLENYEESLKYYNHALNVLNRTVGLQKSVDGQIQVEKGKVNMGIASIYKSHNKPDKAKNHYHAAIVCFQKYQEELTHAQKDEEANLAIEKLLFESKYNFKNI